MGLVALGDGVRGPQLEDVSVVRLEVGALQLLVASAVGQQHGGVRALVVTSSALQLLLGLGHQLLVSLAVGEHLSGLELPMEAGLQSRPGQLLLKDRGQVQVGYCVRLDLAQQALPDASHAAGVHPRLRGPAAKVVDETSYVDGMVLHSHAQLLGEL